MEALTIIILRLVAAVVFSVGAVWLASEGKDGWGWCIFAAMCLGCVTYSSKDGDVKDCL